MLAASLKATLTASTPFYLACVPSVLMATKRKYYAVVCGYKTGVYETWDECELQTKGFKGAKHKSFASKEDAEQYIEESKRSLKVATVGSSSCRSSMSTQIKAPTRRTQMKTPVLQLSSSALETAPDDVEENEVLKRDLDVDQATNATSSRSSIQVTTDLESVSDVNLLYQLEYDGASKGNPGAAGAGALLRHPDGTVVCQISVGLGRATNNVAEYRGLIAGMREALHLGIQRIQAQGDSKLVTMQLKGTWKINNKYLGILCQEARELRSRFVDFEISHVDREYNSAADALANKGVLLPENKFLSSFATVKKLLRDYE